MGNETDRGNQCGEASGQTPRQRRDANCRILTAEEVMRIVEAAKSQRDRATLFVLCESGVMPEELLPLRLKGVGLGKYE